MGLFADDDLQDQRLDNLERHVRRLTETLQTAQADLAQGWIAILSLQAQVDKKVSAGDVDPTITALNEQLATARTELNKASTAAEESWATLQDGVHASFETLRNSVHEATDRLNEG